MNLFKAIALMKTTPADENLARAILYCVEDRQGVLEDREPESGEGSVYERWEETYAAWEYAVDYAQDLVDVVESYKADLEHASEKNDAEETDTDDVIASIEQLEDELKTFQNEYGGISRLQVKV